MVRETLVKGRWHCLVIKTPAGLSCSCKHFQCSKSNSSRSHHITSPPTQATWNECWRRGKKKFQRSYPNFISRRSYGFYHYGTAYVWIIDGFLRYRNWTVLIRRVFEPLIGPRLWLVRASHWFELLIGSSLSLVKLTGQWDIEVGLRASDWFEPLIGRVDGPIRYRGWKPF